MQKTTLAKMISASLCAVALAACGSTSSPVNLTPEQLQAKQNNAQLVGFHIGENATTDAGKKVVSGQITINGKTYTGSAQAASKSFLIPLNINDFKIGYSENTYASQFTDSDNQKTQSKGTMKVYNQPFSFVFGDYMKQFADYGESTLYSVDVPYVEYGGIAADKLPTNVGVTYRGAAFNKNEKGALEYTIKYAANNSGTGSGKITGITSTGDITLKEAKIEGYIRDFNNPVTGTKDEVKAFGVVQGDAQFASGGNSKYDLGIYGPNATEIAGQVTTGNYGESIGFAGEKQ